MDGRKIVYKQTAVVLIGEMICFAVVLAVFALLGKYERSVLLGGLVGSVLSTVNFFFMAVGTSLAADKAENQDVKGGQSLIRFSYTGRLVVLFIVLFACLKSGLFHVIPLLLPLVLVRPILTVAEFFGKNGA